MAIMAIKCKSWMTITAVMRLGCSLRHELGAIVAQAMSVGRKIVINALAAIVGSLGKAMKWK